MHTLIKTPSEIGYIRHAARLLASALEYIHSLVRVGCTSLQLDAAFAEYVGARGGKPAFKEYKGFPGNICVSVNQQVVHGIPGAGAFQAGDIVSVDAGVEYEGFFADAARTWILAPAPQSSVSLVEYTRKALLHVREQIFAGHRLGDISFLIEQFALAHNLTVVKALGGHGIGRQLHEAPKIMNFGPPGIGPRLEQGMVLALEPIFTTGSGELVRMDDGWTVCTKDNAPASHWEETMLLGPSGFEFLTQAVE